MCINAIFWFSVQQEIDQKLKNIKSKNNKYKKMGLPNNTATLPLSKILTQISHKLV